MRYTRLFGKTLREDPAEAETPSHSLLLKAGFIRQLASGIYSYLPLALRSLRKIEGIIRSEVDWAGGQEVKLPALQPAELWEESGRLEAFRDILFTLDDRRARPLVMAPTHEEVITDLAKANVYSYRDLPVILYQIQTKFRDELRPRGGLIRVREFDMKDAYSFDISEDGLAESYNSMVEAYKNIYLRCGVKALQAEADSGAIGGKDSHEFLVPVESGEDIVVVCKGCGYGANSEKAESLKPNQIMSELQPIEYVETPSIRTIDDLVEYLHVAKTQVLKAVFYTGDGELIFVTIRGDLDVNEVKLKNLLKCTELRPATEAELEKAGLVAGYASLVGIKDIRSVADDSVKLGSNFVAGANYANYHILNVNYPRDINPDIITDIALAQAGHFCVKCGDELETLRGIEVGHVFKLGTVFSEKLGANFLDSEGFLKPMIMGCYGIGIGRLLAASIEQNYDDRGIIFNASISPYHVYLAALNVAEEDVAHAAENLYKRLWGDGVEVLYDDRLEAAGVKFNDADLLGFPVRIVVSSRSLQNGGVEVKMRGESDSKILPLDVVVNEIRDWIKAKLAITVE